MTSAKALIVLVVALVGAPYAAQGACNDRDKNRQNLVSQFGAGVDVKLPIDKCPTAKARVRGTDKLAKEGGGFFASRGTSNSCHFGVDLEIVTSGVETGLGKPVFAASKGLVKLASDTWGKAGATVILDHGGNLYTLYGHLDSIDKKKIANGKTVEAGTQIGTVGYSGNAEDLRSNNLPPHLHFMVFRTAEPLANWKPLAIVKESEGADDQLPFMSGFGFLDPSDRLSTLGCL